MKYEIMRVDRLNAMLEKMKVIEPECFDQFVAGVILWYQHEVTHPTPFQADYQINLPPNLFDMFEYPNMHSETIHNLFLDSRVLHHLEESDRTDNEAWDIAVDNLNCGGASYLYPDVKTIFDGYHLFYGFQETGSNEAFFYNPYVKEVW